MLRALMPTPAQFAACEQLSLLGRFEPLGLDVDDHNPRRASEASAADSIKPQASGAEDHDSIARGYAGSVQDGTGPRNDTAAQQRCRSKRHFLRYRCELILVDERPFGEASQTQALV